MAEYSKLESEAALDDAFEAAENDTVVLFKHSLTCPVSSQALREFDRFLDGRADAVRYYLIEVQRQRELSRGVAERTGVKHESPQALILRDGAVAWHASHWNITRDALTEAID